MFVLFFQKPAQIFWGTKSVLAMVLVPLCFLWSNAQAQTSLLPNVIPPSPNAASLGKYGEVPVSYYTGIPSISVPIYTVKAGNIELPITLSYHAGGVRVEEEASWVGLGWSLSAGGVVTRSVVGGDDFSNDGNPSGYLYSPVFASDQEIATNISGLCAQSVDAQPDIFNFNFAGHSGRFILEKRSPAGAPIKVRLLSKGNYRIEYEEVPKRWVITTGEGFKYYFGTHETSRTGSKSGPSPLAAGENEDFIPYDPLAKEIISSWYLDKVESPSSGHVISLFYNRDSYSQSIVSISEAKGRFVANVTGGDCDRDAASDQNNKLLFGTDDNVMTGDVPFLDGCSFLNPDAASSNSSSGCANYLTYSGSQNVNRLVRLERIEFPNGQVRFEAGDREDIWAHRNPATLALYPRAKKLDRIQVHSATGGCNPQSNLQKEFVLSYGYFNPTNGTEKEKARHQRLKLTGVTEYGCDGLPLKPYIFQYNEVNNLPAKNSRARDHWGFFNGATGNESAGPAFSPTLIPRYMYSLQNGDLKNEPGANREADEEKSKTAVLTDIIYPTGGKSKFIYESNVFEVSKSEANIVNVSDFYQNTATVTFEYKTLVTLTRTIKCSTLSCYSTSGTECSLSGAPQYNAPYLSIQGYNTNYTFIHAEYFCRTAPNDPVQCPMSSKIISRNSCEVVFREEITFNPGTYVFTPSPIGNFSVTYNLSYTTISKAPAIPSTKKGGGLRIKEIQTFASAADPQPVMVKKFGYTYTGEGNNVRYGRMMSPIRYHYFKIANVISTNTFGERIRFGGQDSPQSVCVNIESQSYSNIPMGSSAQGSFVGYDRVTETWGGSGEGGKVVYHYKNLPDLNILPFLPNSPTRNFSTRNGLLEKEEYFDASGIKAKEVVNEYYYLADSVNGLFVLAPLGCSGQGGQLVTQVFWKRYQQVSEWWYPVSKTERVYDLGTVQKFLEKKTWYEYEVSGGAGIAPIHFQPTKVTEQSSDGRFLTTENKYAPELGINNLVTRNILNAPLEVTQRVDGSQVSKTKNNFIVSQGFVVPDNVQVANTGGTLETRLKYHAYDDRGNVLEVSMMDGGTVADVRQSYIWGYNKTLPIAKAVGAPSGDIAYTGFESVSGTGDGNWAFTHNAMTVGSKTGKSAHKLNSTTNKITKTLSPSTQYVLSYWLRENSGSVSTGISMTKMETIGGWSYYEGTVSNNSSLTITGSGEIDDLRLYPVGALMTTYTYDPLVGMTSATDENGVTGHYHYDGFGRLRYIADHRGNILKQFQYHYKQ